mmetsp:Transcript_3803/g.9104  ORF Transcript_3803/g.9104 Transcript_3803/m.9104 type:complete len:377 (-) Transcript_3803:1445-2575(-)
MVLSSPSLPPTLIAGVEIRDDVILHKMEGDMFPTHRDHLTDELLKDKEEGEAPMVVTHVDDNNVDDDDDMDEEDDETAMMVRFSSQLEKVATSEVDDAAMELWLEKEEVRDAAQWRPLREFGNAFIGGQDEDAGVKNGGSTIDDEDPYALRVVCFDDIREGLIDFSSNITRMTLLTGALELLGCPFCLWEGTADPELADQLRSAEHSAGPFAAFIRTGGEENTEGRCSSMQWLTPPLASIPGEPPAWRRPSGGAEATWSQTAKLVAESAAASGGGGGFVRPRAVFLTRLLDLALATFPGHAPFALARVEHERCSAGVSAAKACAKALLADRHGDCIPPWIAFARFEWSSGRKQAARNVYDRVINGTPLTPAARCCS